MQRPESLCSLAMVTAEWTALRSPPSPSEAVVDANVREQAIVAEIELQQDLKALPVQLAEMRHLLLGVWKAATPALEELTAATRALNKFALGEDAEAAEGAPREAVESIAQSAGEYEALLGTFSLDWSDAFKELEADDDDPRRAHIPVLAGIG